MTQYPPEKFCTGCDSLRCLDAYPYDHRTPDGYADLCWSCTLDSIDEQIVAIPTYEPPPPEINPELGPWDPADGDWRHGAACRAEDPELFFPIGNTGPALLQIQEAKAVCRSCRSVEFCRAWAVETGQEFGVLGGMSEDERRALKRRASRNRARAST